jgi:hypothetical protein
MKKIYSLLLVGTMAAGCSYDKELLTVPCVIEENISFAGKVAPIIENNCFSCHNDNFKLGNISLQGYSNIKKVAASGKLFNVITHAPGAVKMPKNADKLDDCSINSIKKWIDNGVPDN